MYVRNLWGALFTRLCIIFQCEDTRIPLGCARNRNPYPSDATGLCVQKLIDLFLISFMVRAYRVMLTDDIDRKKTSATASWEMESAAEGTGG